MVDIILFPIAVIAGLLGLIICLLSMVIIFYIICFVIAMIIGLFGGIAVEIKRCLTPKGRLL